MRKEEYTWREYVKKSQRKPLTAPMRAIAYLIMWLCVVFPLWVLSLIVQAHYEYIPPLWLGLWFSWLPAILIMAREVRLYKNTG